MISLDNLTISYGGWTLFDGISFMINPKDRIGLVGKNGAAQTKVTPCGIRCFIFSPAALSASAANLGLNSCTCCKNSSAELLATRL